RCIRESWARSTEDSSNSGQGAVDVGDLLVGLEFGLGCADLVVGPNLDRAATSDQADVTGTIDVAGAGRGNRFVLGSVSDQKSPRVRYPSGCRENCRRD